MGNLFSVIISYGTEKRWPNPAENLSFRVPLYVCIALPFLIFLCEFMLLVETPSWLIMHNKHDKARKTMRWLYPKISEDELNLKLAELAYTIAMEDEFDQEVSTDILRIPYSPIARLTEKQGKKRNFPRLLQGRRCPPQLVRHLPCPGSAPVR